MNEGSVTKNNKLAGWMEEFVNTFVKTTKPEKEDNTKVAEININDLEKVVWNDETFYVYFDEAGASIINSFGNVATQLPGIKTMEEVNTKLNEKQIVSSSESGLEIESELENEINKALAYVETGIVTANEQDDQLAKDYINQVNDSESSSDVNVDFNQDVQQDTQQEIVTSTIDSTGITVSGLNITDELKSVTAELIEEKISGLEKRFEAILDKKLSTIVEQFQARIDPGNIYDLGDKIQQDEISKFNEEAIETEQKINEENSIDRTNPNGKYRVSPIDYRSEEIVKDSDEPEIIDEIVVVTDDEPEVELIGDDAEIFKTGSCPYCNSQLFKTGKINNFASVKCGGCEIDYKINLDDEKIFLK